MMSAKEAINAQITKVKTLLAAIFDDAAPTQGADDTAGAGTLSEYTTDGGVKVMIDQLQVGGKVYQVDGTTPVITGFTLADGTIVMVDESGTITAVTVPVASATPPIVPAVQPIAPMPNGIPAVFEDRIAKLEQEFEAYKTAQSQKFSDQETAHTGKLTQISTAFNEVVSLVEKFGATPSDDPATPPNGVELEGATTKADRRAAFAKNIADRKKATA